ncbi:hypothetical protein GCM10011495_27240 [Hymenobacter frigidus]|uniref:Uncharacterized protein n=1 Tax=Hymenobacter frigidus TaxID=1524095 RepID=A0ABQ2AAR7_9BACT|nr:hypothetical protein GCM10011495_27240 [Hymenobacter frigidus]
MSAGPGADSQSPRYTYTYTNFETALDDIQVAQTLSREGLRRYILRPIFALYFATSVTVD